jgi:hypothetical protein
MAQPTNLFVLDIETDPEALTASLRPADRHGDHKGFVPQLVVLLAGGAGRSSPVSPTQEHCVRERSDELDREVWKAR